MKYKENKAIKAGFWYMVSNFCVKGISFLTTPIFARLLSKTDFGLFNTYLSWQSILLILITLNLESTMISAVFDFKNKIDNYIYSVLVLSSCNVMLFLILAIVFKGHLSGIFGINSNLIFIMLLYLFFVPAVNLFQAREQYLFRYKQNIGISCFITIGTTFLSILFVIVFKDKLLGRVIGAIVPTILLGLVIYFIFFIRFKHINIQYWKYAIPICLPYIPHLLSMTLLSSTDRIMITNMCGPEQNAIYSLAYTCGSLITLITNSLNSAFSPWLGEKLKEQKYFEINKISYFYIGGYFLFSLGVMLISPELLLFFGGKTYKDAVYVMPPVTIGCVCQFIYTMFVNVEQFNKKTKGMAIGSAFAALVNLFLNFIFIPVFGYSAAAYTTLIGYIVLLFIHMWLVKRMGLEKIYNYGYILIIVFGGIILMIPISFLLHVSVIRYIVLLIYVFTIISIIIKFLMRCKDV